MKSFKEYLEETIIKVGDQWRVVSHSGKNLGTYNSKKEAQKRLKEVEYFKHKVS